MRKNHSTNFKAQLVLELLEEKTVSELASASGVQPAMLYRHATLAAGRWKRVALEGLPQLFDRDMGRAQDALTPAWRWVGAGCHLNRRTAESIEMAGFQIVELQERRLLLTPLIVGVTKPGHRKERMRS